MCINKDPILSARKTRLEYTKAELILIQERYRENLLSTDNKTLLRRLMDRSKQQANGKVTS